MNIEFDKRLELMYGLLYCVNKDMNNELHPGLCVEELPNYCSEFYNLYKENASEELINYIQSYGMNGNWNQPAYIALSLDDNYNIVENKNFIKEIIEKNETFDKSKVERLLKDFVIKSNYEFFYNNHKPFYDKIIKSYKEAMNKYNVFDGSFIINFYGYKVGNMLIKLYNFTSGSMGIVIGDNQYYIQRVHNIGKDENNFIFKPKLSVLFHEFSHPYINPLVEKYFSNIDCSDLYQEIIQNDKKSIISTVYTTLNSKDAYKILMEYIVRAVTIYFESKYESKEVIDEKIKTQYDFGFIYIKELTQLFDKRDNYNNFDNFFKNEIVNYILNLKANVKLK